jgi:hypothetical protein
MKLYLAYISIFLITYQNIEREKNVSGKYIGYSLGKHELILKDNGKFVSKGYSLVPKRDEPIFRDLHEATPMGETKKRRYRTKGSWVYFKKDSLDGVLLKFTTQADSLFFLENGNLSPNNPNANEIITTVLNGKDTIYAIKNRATRKEPAEFVKQ